MRHPNRAGGNSTPTCVWHAYANFYQFINIIIMQIIKTVLRTYEYYGKKTMMQIQKYPPKQPLIYQSQRAKAKY